MEVKTKLPSLNVDTSSKRGLISDSYVPVALVTSHAAAVVYLTSIIGLGLYRSHKGLGPAQDTRQRISQRKKLTTAFGSLAVLGFLLSAGSTFSYLKLSYNVWAAERGLEDSNS